MKSHRAPRNTEERESRLTTELTAGNSVDVSGDKRGVNWATGYTKVRFRGISLSMTGLVTDADGWMRGLRVFDACTINFSAFSNGDGVSLVAGQFRMYPDEEGYGRT